MRMMPLSEDVEDCLYRAGRVRALLREGYSLEKALQVAFCLDEVTAQEFIGLFFAELYAEMMGYGRDE